MSIERAEWNGTGAALLFHVALIGALSTSLAHVKAVPEPPSMAVEFVDEVALEAAAPTPIATPAPMEQTPPVEDVPPLDQPVPQPLPPAPKIAPMPAPKPTPAPKQVQRPSPVKPTPRPARPAPRKSNLGDDFLKGLPDGAQNEAPKPSAAKYDAEAKANIAALIGQQIRPCADRQVRIGGGAERLRVVVNLELLPNGRLKGSPDVVRIDGLDDENSKFQDLAIDQAIATYRQCSPLRLPADLYSTPTGGWSNIRLRYQVK